MIKWFIGLFKKKATEPKLIYTWNGLNPEVIRNNWRPGDEYWVLVWWKDFLNQSIYIRSIDPTKERTMTNEQATHVGALAAPYPFLDAPTHADGALAPRLTDEQFAALLAANPLGGVYITDADEVDTDQATAPSPTIH